MPFDLDNLNPTDNAFVSTYPANERAFRTAVEDALNTVNNAVIVEHDPVTGRHLFGAGNATERDGITWPGGGSLWIHGPTMMLQFRLAGVWHDVGIPQGTVMLFQQSVAPVGWTKLTTANDAALRLVSGSTGGTITNRTDFSTIFATAARAVSDTALTIAQMPAHTHGLAVPLAGYNGSQATGGSAVAGSTSGNNTTQSAGGGAVHNHTLSLAVSYVDIIAASKN